MNEERKDFIYVEDLPSWIFTEPDGKPYGTVGGNKYPVVGALLYRGKYIPVLDIPMKEEAPNEQ